MKLTDVLDHFLIDCEVRRRSNLTLDSYRQRMGVILHVLEFECHVTELERVRVAHLRQCVQYLLNAEKPYGCRGRLSAATVRGHVLVLKAFFHWCYQEELIETNLVARLGTPKVDERITPTFTSEHIEKMLSVCDLSTDNGFRDYVMLLLLFDTGLRISEMAMLRVTDVHDTYIKVFGKGRKEREIGLHPEVGKLLWKYIHKHRHPADISETRLFIGRRGPLNRYGVHGIIKRIQHKCGMGGMKVSAHVFRHTFAKMYLARGGEVFKLSREMGHSEVQVTEIYLKDFGSSEARKEHTAFSPITNIHLKKASRRKKGK
jgi:integrase/recombinase XerD